MGEHTAEKDAARRWLMVSRAGIAHILGSLYDTAAVCGISAHNLVLIGDEPGLGERLCLNCSTRVTPPGKTGAES